MSNYHFLYGPVPSRRMGISLGVSPIPDNYCSHSCIYCQLGRTRKLTTKREEFFPLEDIIKEIDQYFLDPMPMDVVTIVGEGEPTLYARLGELIAYLHTKTEKPIAVITNGSLLYRQDVAEELMLADLVLPSVDAVTEKQYKNINRPSKQLSLETHLEGIKRFSHRFKGQLWIETMLVKGFNDRELDFYALKEYLDEVAFERLYINTPVRPPAEDYVQEPSRETVMKAVEILGGIAIDELASEGFESDTADDLEAIKSIIKRHPMNQHEIVSFLKKRNRDDVSGLLDMLNEDQVVKKIRYKGYVTYRLN